MNKILLVLLAVLVPAFAQAQTVNVLGAQYERQCVQEALRDSCQPTGQEFASDLVRVPGVGSRVGECAVAEIAHCAANNAAGAAAPTPAPAAGGKAPSHGRGPSGGRGARR